MGKSLLDIAYEVVASRNDACSFDELWDEVCAQAGVDSGDISKKSRFYTNIMLDGRFVTLGENKWDLRSRHTFDKVHIDMKDVYSEVETSDDDDEEKQGEEGYDSAFETYDSEESEEEEEESSDETETEEF